MKLTLVTFISLSLVVINAQNAEMDCYSDQDYLNQWDGYMNAQPYTNYFFNGEHSVHNSRHEDRRFKFRYCKPASLTDVTQSQQLQQTGYDDTWTRTCKDFNSGNAALSRIQSTHDNHREDRVYTFDCSGFDTTKFKVNDCFWTNPLNNYDGDLNYDCPNNGLMRGMQATHNNHKEDRIFTFECCNIIELKHEFGDIIGEWILLQSCHGCSSSVYRTGHGTESSTSSTIESSYSDELTLTVSAGFEFEGISGSTEVSGTHSSTIAKSMESSFSTSYTEEHEYTCEKTYLYQWVMSGAELRSDGVTGEFATVSNQLLCTDDPHPKCPPLYCSDDGCQTCADFGQDLSAELTSGKYYINNVNSLKSLQCNESTNSIIQSTIKGEYVDNEDQQFLFTKTGDFYTIKCMNNDQYFTIENDSILPGAKIVSESYTGDKNQHFLVYSTDNIEYYFVSVTTNSSILVFDIPARSTVNGAQLIQWSYHNTVNQLFTIKSVANNE